jgi:hypothetical protein
MRKGFATFIWISTDLNIGGLDFYPLCCVNMNLASHHKINNC